PSLLCLDVLVYWTLPPPLPSLFPYTTLFRSPPVTRLRHVGLVPEDLRGGRRKIGVPVVEGQHRAADELVEAGPGGEGDLAHRRDRGEAGGAVRTVLLHGVDVGGRHDLDGLVPGGAHQTALAAGAAVPHRLLGVCVHHATG